MSHVLDAGVPGLVCCLQCAKVLMQLSHMTCMQVLVEPGRQRAQCMRVNIVCTMVTCIAGCKRYTRYTVHSVSGLCPTANSRSVLLPPPWSCAGLLEACQIYVKPVCMHQTMQIVPMRATLRTALSFCNENSRPRVNSRSCTPT